MSRRRMKSTMTVAAIIKLFNSKASHGNNWRQWGFLLISFPLLITTFNVSFFQWISFICSPHLIQLRSLPIQQWGNATFLHCISPSELYANAPIYQLSSLTVSFYCSLLCSGQKPPPLPVNTHSLVVGHVTDGSGYKSCCLDNEKQKQQRHQSIYLSVAMTPVVLHTKGVLLSQSECHFVDHFTTTEPAPSNG